MKGSRIFVCLFVLLLIAVAAVLLMRWRPSPMPALPVPNENAAAPKQGAEAPAPRSPGPVDLGSVLGFASLADCSPSSALASVLEQMVRIDPRTFESRRGGPISVPGYAQPITPPFERRREVGHGSDIREVTADLDLPGRWHGLAVTGLRRSFYEESDASAFDVRFAEPPERVRETLVRQGFRLRPVGEFREVDAEPGISTEIGVGRIDGGAALTCATG